MSPGTVTYGLNIQAWWVFLLAARHVPVARCAEIIASLSGIRPSDGFVHAFKACQVSVAGTWTKSADDILETLAACCQRVSAAG